MRQANSMDRRTTLLTLGALLVVIMYGVDWAAYTLAPPIPRFFVIWLQFYAVKVVGDVFYYRLRRRYRDFASLTDYLGNDLLTQTRFAFPLAVAQRLAEAAVAGSMQGGRSLLTQLVAGPYLAILVYLVNRLLREQAHDGRFHAGRRLRHLP